MLFLIDENLPQSLAPAFENHGHNALHVTSLEQLRGQPDEVIFEYAAAKQLIIVTRDLNFANPIRFNLSRLAGIVVLRFPNDISMKQLAQDTASAIGAL